MKNNSILWFSIIVSLLVSSPVQADVKVQFFEGAPKDEFAITNESDCDWGARRLEIDFSDSNGRLIFDVTGSGADVEVFPPLEVTAGAERLVEQPKISDGDQIITLVMSGLGVDETIEFTTDVDDTNGSREITAANDEINGKIVTIFRDGSTFSAKMDADAQVVITKSNFASQVSNTL